MESEVLEERDVEEEDTEDSREDFLSGTFGFALPVGHFTRSKEVTGVPAVGVLDWLEYPLDGEVRRWTFSGDDTSFDLIPLQYADGKPLL